MTIENHLVSQQHPRPVEPTAPPSTTSINPPMYQQHPPMTTYHPHQFNMMHPQQPQPVLVYHPQPPYSQQSHLMMSNPGTTIVGGTMPAQQPLTLQTTKFQDLFQQSTLNASSHTITLKNEDSPLKYYFYASCGLFRVCRIMKEVSHITILPPIPKPNAEAVPPSKLNCCCDCCCSGGSCNDGCSMGNSASIEGVIALLAIVAILLLLSLVFIFCIYLVTAPIAILLIMYYEKITTVEFNDEKREIQWTSRAKYFRDYSFVFSTHTLSYDQVHDVYEHSLKQTTKESIYCLLIEAKDGSRINISKPLPFTYYDLRCGAVFLKDFLSKRGVVFVAGENNHYNGLTNTTSTMPMNHQMV